MNHSGSRDDHLKFKKLRNKVVAKLRHAKSEIVSNLHPHNQKEFWKVVKSLNTTAVVKSLNTKAVVKSLNTKQSIVPTL